MSLCRPSNMEGLAAGDGNNRERSTGRALPFVRHRLHTHSCANTAEEAHDERKDGTAPSAVVVDD